MSPMLLASSKKPNIKGMAAPPTNAIISIDAADLVNLPILVMVNPQMQPHMMERESPKPERK